MIDEDGHVHYARAKNADGRRTHVTPLTGRGVGSGSGGQIERIQVFGREELNYAERERDAFLHSLLQGKCDLNDPAYDLIQRMYFPEKNDSKLWPPKIQKAGIVGRLNQSQANVVLAMVKSEVPFVIVHGEIILDCFPRLKADCS